MHSHERFHKLPMKRDINSKKGTQIKETSKPKRKKERLVKVTGDTVTNGRPKAGRREHVDGERKTVTEKFTKKGVWTKSYKKGPAT